MLRLSQRRCLSSASASAARPRVLVLAGPTGAGKSEVAVRIARRLGGEVVNGDSVQMYAQLEVGANRLPLAQRQGVPHHLLGHVPSFEADYSAADFFREARGAIRDILARGRVPVVVGGSGFYLRWLLYGPAQTGKPAPGAREEARARYAGWAWHEVAEDLRARHGPSEARDLYLERAGANERRLLRAAELLAAGGGEPPPPEPHLSLRHADLDFDFRCAFLSPNRVWLLRALDARCERMAEAGLLREVSALRRVGFGCGPADAPPPIGYRQAVEFLDALAREEAPPQREFELFVRSFQAASRQYARRQLSWYRQEPLFRWVPVRTRPAAATELCDDWLDDPGDKEARRLRRRRLLQDGDRYRADAYRPDLEEAAARVLREVWEPAEAPPPTAPPAEYATPEGWDEAKVRRALRAYVPRPPLRGDDDRWRRLWEPYAPHGWERRWRDFVK